MGRLFGTDGIRGVANRFPMTGEVALSVGRAIAAVLQSETQATVKSSFPVGLKPLESQRPLRRARVVVGKDTRLSGYMLEHALASGLCSMGVDVILIGPLPTPGVAFVTQSMRADAGIMISASHNAFSDNGIKIFSADGYKFPDAWERRIEEWVQAGVPQSLPVGDLVGKAARIDEVHGRYLVFLKGLFPRDLDLLGVRLALDCANGAAYKVAPLVFEELGAEVIKIGVQPNGLNINEQCGALHPEGVAATTVKFRADLGIALDGDGDRCIFSDETGEVVDGDQILGLCALDSHHQGLLKGATVVTTPLSNGGLEETLQENGIQLIRVPVGDRHVVEALRKNRWNFGGEPSGHLIFLDHATTGDGLVAALKVLEIMKRTGKPLSELKKQVRLYPQAKWDLPITKRLSLETHPPLQKAIAETEAVLKGRGRLVIRYSGTEPLIRLLVESPDALQGQQLVEKLGDVVRHELG